MPSDIIREGAHKIAGLAAVVAMEPGYFSDGAVLSIADQRKSINCMMENAQRIYETGAAMDRQLAREERAEEPPVRVQVTQVGEQRHYELHVQSKSPLTVIFPEVKRIWPEAVGMLFVNSNPQFSVINERGRVVFEGAPQFAKD